MNTENSTKTTNENAQTAALQGVSAPAHRLASTARHTPRQHYRRPHAASRTGPDRMGGKSRNSNHQHRGPRKAFPQKKEDDVIPPLDNDTVRILTLGGVEEVGKNMTAIEFRNDIIIVDMGFQFKEEVRKV